jgi:hypothetical protein
MSSRAVSVSAKTTSDLTSVDESVATLARSSKAGDFGFSKRYPRRIEGLPARLRQAFEGYGSVTATSRAIERSEGALRKWLRGRSEPTASDLRAICELTGVGLDWLIFGTDAFRTTEALPPGALTMSGSDTRGKRGKRGNRTRNAGP